MPTIAEVRSQYPQYGDLSDEQLAGALHKKFYADMPYADFTAKIGLKSTQPEKPPVTMGDRVNAAVGGVNRGLLGLAGLPMDTVQNAYNLGKATVGTVATAAGRPDLAPDLTKGTPLTSEWLARQAKERLGVDTAPPRPDDPASRMLNTAGMIAGGSMVPGASIPGTAAAAAGGALAGEALGPQYVGIGAMAPAAAAQAGLAAKRAIADRTKPTLDTFKEAGAVPSVGEVTRIPFLQGVENLISKFPGGTGVMKAFHETFQRDLGANTRTRPSAEDAGRAIEKGVTGEGGFLDRTKAVWTQLDDKLAARIPANASFAPSNTLQALDDLTRPTPGAEKTTAALVNPKIAEMRANLADDIQANNGQVPFGALRALRSKVGSMLDNALVSGIPGGELKKVYGALSKDMEAAATAAGAEKQFTLQNNYYRARMERVETVLERVIGKGKQPEDIFKAFNPTDVNQANKVRSVMRSLRPDERQVVSEAVVNRLGRATPGRQNEVGDIFSSETFLTNWNKLSPGAKAQLFPDGKMRSNLEAVAKAASTLRSGHGVAANPSGTAGSFAAYSVYLSPLAAVASGSIAPVVAAGGAAGAAYVGAKMLTSPKVVEWLSTPVKPNSPQAAVHLARLGVIYNETKDESLKGELEQFMQSLQQ